MHTSKHVVWWTTLLCAGWMSGCSSEDARRAKWSLGSPDGAESSDVGPGLDVAGESDGGKTVDTETVPITRRLPGEYWMRWGSPHDTYTETEWFHFQPEGDLEMFEYLLFRSEEERREIANRSPGDYSISEEGVTTVEWRTEHGPEKFRQTYTPVLFDHIEALDVPYVPEMVSGHGSRAEIELDAVWPAGFRAQNRARTTYRKVFGTKYRSARVTLSFERPPHEAARGTPFSVDVEIAGQRNETAIDRSFEFEVYTRDVADSDWVEIRFEGYDGTDDDGPGRWVTETVESVFDCSPKRGEARDRCTARQDLLRDAFRPRLYYRSGRPSVLYPESSSGTTLFRATSPPEESGSPDAAG